MTDQKGSPQWQADCVRWRGKVLTGKYGHWCPDWDDLPIDETSLEWPCACAEYLVEATKPTTEDLASRIVELLKEKQDHQREIERLRETLQEVVDRQREAVTIINKQGAAFPGALAAACEKARDVLRRGQDVRKI